MALSETDGQLQDSRGQFYIALASMFSALTPKETATLLALAKQTKCLPGEVILREGERSKALYIVSRGEVDVTQRNPLTDDVSGNIHLARLGIGSIFGEMSFIEDSARSATISAHGNVELYCINEGTIHDAMGKSLEFSVNFYKSLASILSHRLRVTNILLRDSYAKKTESKQKGLKFFIVDNDNDEIKLITELLESDGHSVLSSNSATLSIPEIVSSKSDCVIVDYIMPDMDVEAFNAELRSHLTLDKMKIIMLSKWSESVWADRAKESEANGFIAKPIDKDEFTAIVMGIINE